MTFGSLFSGIGGIDLGFERAGMECRWQVEIDPSCNRVLAKHWPNVKRYGDIKEINCDELQRVDVVAGGYPCQPFSVAGKRRGASDDRHLWPQMFRLVRELRPTWVVGENVAGHVSMGLDDVLADLEAEGYACRAFVLPAAGVGAPHLRHRVFVVGHSDSHRRDTDHGREPVQDGNWNSAAHEGGWQELKPRADCPGDVADAEGFAERTGLRASEQAGQRRGRPGDGSCTSICWPTEPDVGRVAHGVPCRVDRLRALGNAVVPQVAEAIGHAIMGASR